MQLTDEAKELISEEFEKLSKDIEGTLQELRLYKWVLRGLFVLLFGGTIVGVLKLQDYLDDRIQKRNEELSGIIYGSLAHTSGDPRAAVDQYYSFLEKLDSAVLRPSESIRSIYYHRFIEALADAHQLEPNGEFEVKGAFTALLDTKLFKRDYITNSQRWRNDPLFLNSWARCLVKFSESAKELESAREFFDRAAVVADRPSEVASNYFGLAMLSLAKGNGDQASEFLKRASSKSPRTHALKSSAVNFKNDLEGETEVWERAARIFEKPGIEKRYETVVSRLKAEEIEREGATDSNKAMQGKPSGTVK